MFDIIENELKQVENLLLSQDGEVNPELITAIENTILSGGKRIRPSVAILAGKMLHAPIDRIIALAAAIEMLHTATLIHDDLIDGSLLRRGNPTINARWSPSATVLAGDYAFAKAAAFGAGTYSIPVMELFAETLATIVNGELDQLFRHQLNVNIDDYLSRIYAKTGSMFVLATEASAVLAGVSEDVFQAVRSFGYYIGMAFQIIDDVLDFVGNKFEVGKPTGNDLRNGLCTLPAIYYYRDNPEDSDMNAYLGGDSMTDKSMDELVNRIRSSQSIDDSRDEAKKFIEKGLNGLLILPETSEKDSLIELSEFVISRKL